MEWILIWKRTEWHFELNYKCKEECFEVLPTVHLTFLNFVVVIRLLFNWPLNASQNYICIASIDSVYIVNYTNYNIK